MSKNLRKCMNTMHIFCCTKNPKLKKSILKEMLKNSKFSEAFYEIVNNIHLKNINLKNLTPAQKRKAKKYLPVMTKILKHPKKQIRSKKLVEQTGGWIQFVLPILTTVVTDLINDAISKKSDSGSP